MKSVLFYEVVDDYLARRGQFRQEHLALARAAHERGELLLAGAFDDPADGAMLVFDTQDTTLVEAFVRADPYVREGLVTAWRIRMWNEVVASPPA